MSNDYKDEMERLAELELEEGNDKPLLSSPYRSGISSLEGSQLSIDMDEEYDNMIITCEKCHLAYFAEGTHNEAGDCLLNLKENETIE
jgi:hypothetical protein